MSNGADLLKHIEQAVADRALPPVHDWHPGSTRDIDIVIERDARWYYQGSLIDRQRMVRLFSSVLRVDDDNHTYLVTPQEKLRIRVVDAPFMATLVERHGAPQATTLVFKTNIGDTVVADSEHPIQVEYKQPSGEPSPYIVVRDRLRALISRPAFYQLAEWAEERDGFIGVESAGHFMRLSESYER